MPEQACGPSCVLAIVVGGIVIPVAVGAVARPAQAEEPANRNPSPLDCFFHETRDPGGVTIFPDPRKRPEMFMALACAGSRAPRAEGRGSMATITRSVVLLSAVV